jgi:hypothetical protein
LASAAVAKLGQHAVLRTTLLLMGDESAVFQQHSFAIPSLIGQFLSTVLAGLPAALIFLVPGEFFGIRNFWYYLLFGFAMVLPQVMVFALLLGQDPKSFTSIHTFESKLLLALLLLPGVLAGVAYWLVAGRTVGLRGPPPA